MSHAAIQRTHILKQQNSTSIYKYKHTYNKIKKKNMAWIHIKFMIRLPLGKEEKQTCEENIWGSNFNI